MPAYDFFHHVVKNALMKENWNITHDPLSISLGGVDLYIDLGAERLLAAEKEGQKIAIEIKGFSSGSLVSEFHAALGQFLNYRLALKEDGQERKLYLAIAEDTYREFFTRPFVQLALREHKIDLLIFNPELEVISQWLT